MPETSMPEARDITRFVNQDSIAEYLPLLEESLHTLSDKLRAQGIPVDDLGRIEDIHGRSKDESERSPNENRSELLERTLMLLLQQGPAKEHILALGTASPDKAKQHVAMILLGRETLQPLAGLSFDQGLPQTIPGLQQQIRKGNFEGQRRVEQFMKRSQQGVTLEHCVRNSPRGIIKTPVHDLPLLYLTLPEKELLELAGSLTESTHGTKSATETQHAILKSIIKSLVDQCTRMEKFSQEGIMKTPSYLRIQEALTEVQKSIGGID